MLAGTSTVRPAESVNETVALAAALDDEALEALHSGSYNGAYALLTAAREQAQRLVAANPELCDLAFPTVTVSYDPGTWVYSYAEVGAVLTGDVNGDGIVNAEDASRILIVAAFSGLNQWKTLQDDPGREWKARLAADVNKDNAIDSTDASYVLIYAATSGLKTASWSDIIR